MCLSVVAVSLILLFSQSTLAQRSSGGGGSSEGGTSSGGSSSGSSGGASHGGGGSGSTRGSSSSHAASGHETANGPAGEPVFYSSVHGESSEVHNPLVDQALGKLQYALPANIKNDQPISAKSQERIEPDRKPYNGHHCNPHPVREHFAPGSNWRTSQDLYNTIHGDCGHLAAKLQQEENRVAALQSSQEIACAMSPVGSECSSATGTLNKLNAKIAQLHDRYDRCVLHDLRHNAAVYPPCPKSKGLSA
jgi:hypothetical protein